MSDPHHRLVFIGVTGDDTVLELNEIVRGAHAIDVVGASPDAFNGSNGKREESDGRGATRGGSQGDFVTRSHFICRTDIDYPD